MFDKVEKKLFSYAEDSTLLTIVAEPSQPIWQTYYGFFDQCSFFYSWVVLSVVYAVEP